MANKDKDAWREEWMAGVGIATARSGGKEDILDKGNAESASKDKGKRHALADISLLNLEVVEPKAVPVEYGRTKVKYLAADDQPARKAIFFAKKVPDTMVKVKKRNRSG